MIDKKGDFIQISQLVVIFFLVNVKEGYKIGQNKLEKF